MKQYTCKKCGNKNKLLAEWVNSTQAAIIIACTHCGNKARYRPTRTENGASRVQSTIVTNTANQLNNLNSALRLDVISGVEGQAGIDIVNKPSDYKIYFGREPQNMAAMHAFPEDEFLIINDPFVSRLHGILQIRVNQENLRVSVEDQGSSNGTKVNQNTLELGDIIRLRLNDILLVGETQFKLIGAGS